MIRFRETVELKKKDARNVIFSRCFVVPDTGWKEKECGKIGFSFSIENYCGLSSLMTTQIRHIR